MKRLVIVSVLLCSLVLPGWGAKVVRQPGDEELEKQVPFMVDVKKEGYPRILPENMTDKQLAEHYKLMAQKRKVRDKKLIQKKLNETGVNPEGNPYKGK